MCSELLACCLFQGMALSFFSYFFFFSTFIKMMTTFQNEKVNQERLESAVTIRDTAVEAHLISVSGLTWGFFFFNC